MARVTRTKSVYLTEKEICDSLWERGRGFLLPTGHGEVLREQTIGYGLRPDFMTVVGFPAEDGMPPACFVDAIEVKRHADVMAVAQVCNYLYVLRKHAASAYHDMYPDHFWRADHDYPSVNGHLLALTFDKEVYSTAYQARVTLSRLVIDPGTRQVSIEREPHVYEKTPLDNLMVEFLTSRWGRAAQ